MVGVAIGGVVLMMRGGNDESEDGSRPWDGKLLWGWEMGDL